MSARSEIRCFKLCVRAAALCAAIFLARPARAESWLLDAEIGLGTGLEGGNADGQGIDWQRARTRVVAGFEMRVDESETEGVAFRAFTEIEQRASIGAEARYVRWMSRGFGLYVGALGTIAPRTLFGGGVGARFVIPFGKRVGLFLEPSFNALPLGSDLPDDTVPLWVLGSAGLRFGL